MVTNDTSHSRREGAQRGQPGQQLLPQANAHSGQVPEPNTGRSGIEQEELAASRTSAVISIHDLTKTYPVGQTYVRALQGVSLEVHRHEFVAIMGQSGSGKSTLMNLIGCLDRPTSGDYRLDGEPVEHLSSSELAAIRNRCIGFVFQVFNLLPRATVLTNVALPLVYTGLPKEEREMRARQVLQLVGLGDRVSHRPSQLSGGQQQRVAIARALVNSPSLLLADEPTGNLDSRTSAEILATLQVLHQRGLTIVLVTHDPTIAAYAHRQIELHDGRIVRDVLIPPLSLPPSLASTPANGAAEGNSASTDNKEQRKEEAP
jgi:putative ABC transport system ATP-binding protein